MCCICVHWNGTLGVLAEGSILYMYGPSWAVSDLNPLSAWCLCELYVVLSEQEYPKSLS